MATQFAHDDRNVRTTRTVGTGSVVEAVAAGAAIALAIIALAGAAPVFLAAIATIVIGVALILEGGGIYTRHHEFLAHHEPGAEVGQTPGAVLRDYEDVGRTSSEAIAGIAGVVLGILALINVSPRALLPIALIVFGGGLLMGSNGFGERSRSGHAFVGVGAVVLGILALVGVEPYTLDLIGLLCVGVALFFAGMAWTTHTFRPMHHHPAH